MSLNESDRKLVLAMVKKMAASAGSKSASFLKSQAKARDHYSNKNLFSGAAFSKTGRVP